MEGICKWFSSKGQPWGYIKFKDEQGASCEIFVHYKQILPDNQENPKFRVLKPGQRVAFDIGSGYPSKGTQAMNVRALDGYSGVGNAGVEAVLPQG
jgi:cold shock CspA family protein